MGSTYQTCHTLLQRACDAGDGKAWTEFVQIYRRFIFYVLREIGVDDNDVDDLAQQVLLSLTGNLNSYDKSRARFRTWLSAVIKNTALDHFRRQKSRKTRLQVFGLEQSIEQVDKSSEITKMIENEWSTYIANLAMERVRGVFQGQAVPAFELGLDGLSVAEISEQTGLSISSVYTLRKRVKKRLYLEIRSLTMELEG